MKFSTAIRLGAMDTAQAFEALYVVHHQVIVRTCAIGAALHAAGLPMRADPADLDKLPNDWPLRDFQARRCPVAKCEASGALVCVIAHLNDYHRWTREQIADYVEREIEAKQEQPQAADAVTV